MTSTFRNFLYPFDSPRLATAREQDARAFGDKAREGGLPGRLVARWDELAAEPFHGITCDGRCEHGLFPLEDEGAPVGAMTGAARVLLGVLSEANRAKVRHPIDAPQWRRWSNPEFLVNDNGLRLEDLAVPERAAVLGVLEASLSQRGFDKARDCMRTNAFLGELTALPRIMNEWSYNFLLFGEPSETEPWGWSLYGHHLVLNCLVANRQMVISPTFMGAEPNEIDTGPLAGTRLFVEEETAGLALMRSLAPDARDEAQRYLLLNDPSMPEGRWHPADQRHLGGAFQDNRVIPYEGICAGKMTAAQRDEIVRLAGVFVEYLPSAQREVRLRQVEAHLDRTWWSWIGGYGDDDPFYYRIQSPVIMIEFDHHSGVWLNNQEPAKCHIHTVVRTPNGNDYGKDLLRLHYARTHPGRRPGCE